MEDSAILDMYFERQEAALDKTKYKYGKRLFRTSKNILHNNEDAEECVSDTLLKAWEAIPPSRPIMFSAFLMKIARNTAINKLEAKNATKRGGGELNLFLDELEDCIPSAKNLEEEYEASHVTDTINSFLGTISKPARVAFILRYFHGDSIYDISKRFQVSESKIKSNLFRTRKKLRIYLEKEGVAI